MRNSALAFVASLLPSRRRTIRTWLIALGVAGAALLASGCSSGQITQTSSQVPAIPGIDAQVGSMAIRNALIAPPPELEWGVDSLLPLSVVFVNQGTQTDSLLDVSSEQTESANLFNGSIPTEVETTPTPTPSQTSTASVSPTPSATPSPQAPEAPSGESLPVSIAPGKLVRLTGTGEVPRYIGLLSLTRPLNPSQTLKVTFTFEKAGKTTLTLPIGPPADPAPRETPSPAEAEPGKEH